MLVGILQLWRRNRFLDPLKVFRKSLSRSLYIDIILISCLTHWLPTIGYHVIDCFYYEVVSELFRVDYELSRTRRFWINVHPRRPTTSLFAVKLLVWNDVNTSVKFIIKIIIFLLPKLTFRKLTFQIRFHNWPLTVNVLINYR